MATSLLDALKDYWTAAGLDVSVGPIAEARVVSGAVAPYARIVEIGGKVMRNGSRGYAERPMYQVSVFAPDADARALGSAAMAEFDRLTDDNSLVSFDDGTLTGWGKSDAGRLIPDPGVDGRGRPLSHFLATYTAKVSRTRPGP
jgi:hypothetical protein